METKQISLEQRTNFERYLPILDEVITILQRIEKREQKVENIDEKRH